MDISPHQSGEQAGDNENTNTGQSLGQHSEYLRNKAIVKAVSEGESVAHAADRYGVSRQWAYELVRRWRVPKLKGALFESAVIQRYRRREESVEEALIEMYLAGVSTRRVDDISRLLWGTRMPSQTLSDKLKGVYGDIDRWRERPLEGDWPYVFMDGVWHRQLLGRGGGECLDARSHRRQCRGSP